MYQLNLTANEIEIIATMLKEGPYKYVKDVLDNIAKQIDNQNNKNNQTLSTKKK